jgi:2C-methyl-D-erythritol 2,4-cyclodiphosphate synthase
MAARANVTRAGFGYDIHPLVAGRKLVLGGLEI